ncbi:MAG: adenylosuccinate synthetase, partial [Candidatus Methanomethylicota archaeon]
EIENTDVKNRICVDYNSGIMSDEHVSREKGDEQLMKKIGSTGSGVGTAMVDRVLRSLKLAKDYPELSPFLTNVAEEVNAALDRGEAILLEGTQGLYLSLYHGTYPYVTSRDVTASAVCSEVGVGPRRVDEVIVVLKAYVTRVGEGPLEGELSEEEAAKRGWLEVATVTGRKRRAAPFNFKMARRAVKINSASQVAITKLDTVFKGAYGLKDFEKLPLEAKEFIEEVEEEVGVPVTLISTGPDVYQVIDRRS